MTVGASPENGVFCPTVQDGYEWAAPVDSADFAVFNTLNAEIRGPRWRPVRMEIVRGRGHSKYSDAPWLGSDVLILRQKAADVLRSRIAGVGELLPLDCGDDELYALNITRTADADDRPRSEGGRDELGPTWLIMGQAVRSRSVRDAFAFKLPQLDPSPIFVSPAFVQCVAEARLIGIEFAHLEVRTRT